MAHRIDTVRDGYYDDQRGETVTTRPGVQIPVDMKVSVDRTELDDTVDTIKAITAQRSGLYTTEFWITALCIIAAVFLLAIGRITVSDVLTLAPIFGAAGLYSISRWIAKKK